MNNRTLSIIFFALLGVYLLTRLFSGKQERTFRTELLQVDTSLVNKIELYPKTADGQTVSLSKANGQWTVTDGNITAGAVTSSVQSLLNQMVFLKAKRVVAKSEDKWKDYEVELTNGSRVKAYQDGNVLADFVVGRFNFNQQTRTAISYVRLTEEPEVYSVDGFLSMTFGQDINAFRNKQILKLGANEQVTGLQLQAGEALASFQNTNGAWLLNSEQTVDSTEMANYLNGLKFVAGSTFADGFTPSGSPAQSLRIDAGMAPVTINAYRDTRGESDFIIQSSQFPEALFASDSSGIYSRLFTNLSNMIILE